MIEARRPRPLSEHGALGAFGLGLTRAVRVRPQPGRDFSDHARPARLAGRVRHAGRHPDAPPAGVTGVDVHELEQVEV
jgi:hypothetical protein